jgi:hypothetical protein
MPGDTVFFRGGHPRINGIEVPSCVVGSGSYRDSDGGREHSGEVDLEALDGRQYLTFYDAAARGSEEEQGP